MKRFIVVSQIGCLLPFLIIFNLFFGWLFFKRTHWLLIELALLSIFILTSIIIARGIWGPLKKRDNVIDVKGEIVQERHRLKRDA